jgi:alpha,alpha-trehalase
MSAKSQEAAGHQPGLTAEDGPVSTLLPHVLREYALREYALIADGERGALVGPRGDIAWMYAPQWHSDAVFATLVGGAGCYTVTPADPRHVWGGYYEDGSLIWRSRWITTDGVIECREALAYPGDAGTAVLLRRIQAIDIPARVRVRLDVRAGFGRHAMTSLECGTAWTGRAGPLYLRWSGGQAAAVCPDGGLALELTVAPGDRHDFVLELSRQPLRAGPVAAEGTWRATEAAWARELPAFADSLAPRPSRHSYAVLAGLTSGSGAMVAAVTTSLPERAEAGRNYEYRYAYLGGSARVGSWVDKQFQLDALGEALLESAARLARPWETS